jgi:RNA polymerase sigma factor, sigma-70 family
MEELELIRLLKQHPEQGIHEAMNLYGKSVETICKNFLYDCSEADLEEAIADSFINLWKNIDHFDQMKGYSLKSYLYAIARNAARDKRRKLKKATIFSLEEVQLDLPDSLNIEEEFEKQRSKKILHEILNHTEEPDRTIFILRYFYGEKVNSIAVKLGLESKRVENILFRRKKKLEKALVERGVCGD